jgi:hypothetical protein
MSKKDLSKIALTFTRGAYVLVTSALVLMALSVIGQGGH